jgi:hypothetical protein
VRGTGLSAGERTARAAAGRARGSAAGYESHDNVGVVAVQVLASTVAHRRGSRVKCRAATCTSRSGTVTLLAAHQTPLGSYNISESSGREEACYEGFCGARWNRTVDFSTISADVPLDRNAA